MLKHFTYQFIHSDFIGYRLLDEKNIFANLKKLVYDDFKILYSDSNTIHFNIDTQLIRKLKLKKLSDEISINSKEGKLLELLERSKESVIYSTDNFYSEFSYSCYYDNYDTKIDTNNRMENRDRNKFIMTQSKMNNRKVKQYNKFHK
jgi:hypothetical protein